MSTFSVRDLAIFEVDVTATFEIVRRDEFGSERTGKWASPEVQTSRILARREEQAREKALERYRYSGARDVSVVTVRSSKLDAIILEFCP